MNTKEAFYKVMSATAVVAALAGCSGEKGTGSVVNATPIPGVLLGCKHAEQNDSVSVIAKEMGAGPEDRATVQRGMHTIHDGAVVEAPGLQVTVPRNIAGTPMPELTISDNVCIYKK